jgi:hypothetical protein
VQVHSGMITLEDEPEYAQIKIQQCTIREETMEIEALVQKVSPADLDLVISPLPSVCTLMIENSEEQIMYC